MKLRLIAISAVVLSAVSLPMAALAGRGGGWHGSVGGRGPAGGAPHGYSMPRGAAPRQAMPYAVPRQAMPYAVPRALPRSAPVYPGAVPGQRYPQAIPGQPYQPYPRAMPGQQYPRAVPGQQPYEHTVPDQRRPDQRALPPPGEQRGPGQPDVQPRLDRPGEPNGGRPAENPSGNHGYGPNTNPGAPRPSGQSHMPAPPAPQAGVHDDRTRTWHGYNYRAYGPRSNYYGSHYRGPRFVPSPYGYAYPYPYIYPDYYDSACFAQDGGYWPNPDMGEWSILVSFNGQELMAYWDPCEGGYWVYDDEWGYVQVQAPQED